MRKIVLYLAMSVDGCIADHNGGVDWLSDQEENSGNMGSYPQFIQTVDTVLMGYTTYHQITTELFSGGWPYQGMQTYVFTHRKLPDQPEITFTEEAPAALVQRLLAQQGKDIWVCGGANLACQLMAADLIDRYHLTVIPTLLGNGVRLFPEGIPQRKLRLLSAETFSGMTDLVYVRRNLC